METTERKTDVTDLPSPAPDSPKEALGWLGGTADEVAANLRLRGIKGHPTFTGYCPLAMYLKTWWQHAFVWDDCRAWNPGTNSAMDTTPLPCFEFAKKFDKREYPDLLA